MRKCKICQGVKELYQFYLASTGDASKACLECEPVESHAHIQAYNYFKNILYKQLIQNGYRPRYMTYPETEGGRDLFTRMRDLMRRTPATVSPYYKLEFLLPLQEEACRAYGIPYQRRIKPGLGGWIPLEQGLPEGMAEWRLKDDRVLVGTWVKQGEYYYIMSEGEKRIMRDVIEYKCFLKI